MLGTIYIYIYIYIYIPVNVSFNLPDYVISYMDHTSKKESEKIDSKKKKKKVTENLLQEDSNLDSQNQLELKVNTSIHWTTSVNTDVQKRSVILLYGD